MLNATYRLHDVGDVEALCVRAARRYCDRTRTRLQPVDFDGLVAFLVAAAWRCGDRYDPSRGVKFSALLNGILSNRCTDWMRQFRGRTKWQWATHSYERQRPQPLSLDAPAGDDGRTLADFVADRDGDPQADRGSVAFRELLADRDREAPWDQALCRAAARRVAGDGAVVQRH